jgi:hypothetical protein
MGAISDIEPPEPGLLVFHPDCGGLLLNEPTWCRCEKCGTRVSFRDRWRIIHEFQRPGEWKPLHPDPLRRPT